MKKFLSLLLAILMCAALFAGCADEKNNPDNPENPGNENPGNEDPKTPGLAGGKDNTADWPHYQIVYWGDATLSANDLGDIVESLGAADGIKITSHGRTYDNIEGVQTSNLYETVTFTGTKPNYTGAKLKNGNTDIWQLKAMENADFFVVLSGRDRSLVQGTDANIDRTKLALKAWYDKYKELSPEGKMVLYVPQGFDSPAGSALWNRFSSIGLNAMTRAEHNEAIKKSAADLAAVINNDCDLVQVGDAYEAFIAKNPDISMYDAHSGRFSSVAGSYYSACVLYSSLFGKSTVGMNVGHPDLDSETCLFLQQAADEYVKSTGKTLTAHTEDKNPGMAVPKWTDPRLDPNTDPKYADEVYPENYDVIMSTLYAYDMRWQWVQYDNMNFDRVQKSYNRRDHQAAPEIGTPQNYLYTDCSAYIAAAYIDTFDFDFEDGNRCNHWIKRTQYQKFFWAEKTADISTSQAIAQFLDTLQPGDVFVYTDYGNIGHTGVYVGGGKVIHCTGMHACGGGENYYFDADTDAWEYDGAIVWNNIEDFTQKNGRFEMFKSGVEVAILRPLDYVGEPTQNALNRMNNMYGIRSYKHTTAPEGITVSTGSDVTFTFVIENLNDTEKTVSIEETLPAGLNYKSGDGEFKDGKFTASVTLKSGEKKEVAYTVTVTAANGTTVEVNEAYLGGVKTNPTDIDVANTLTEADIAKLLSKLANGTKGSDAYALAVEAYKELGIHLGTLENEMKSIFKFNTGATENYVTRINENTNKMLPLNMFGGRNYVYQPAFGDTVYPILRISLSNLVEGDIVVYNEDGKASGANVYVYVGDNTLATVENGSLKYLSKADSSGVMKTLMGRFSWFVLRPSLSK